MILWVDAQLSPEMASWIAETLSIQARPLRDLGLVRAKDREIYLAAREAGAVILTKDRDFLNLLQGLGAPPQVLWVTCGNTSNARLKQLFRGVLPTALNLLEQGESLVEISDAS